MSNIMIIMIMLITLNMVVVMMKLLWGDRRRWFDFTLSFIHSSSCFTMITIINSEEEEESSLHIFVHFFVSPNFMWYTHCSWMMKDDIFCIWWRASAILWSAENFPYKPPLSLWLCAGQCFVFVSVFAGTHQRATREIINAWLNSQRFVIRKQFNFSFSS